MNQKNDAPKITLALFCYNQEKFVAEAANGALAQTYPNLEIILSDDHSTDRTFSILEEIVNGYRGPHQVRLNRNPQNLGLCGHVNRVFEIASSDWIVMAAGDDISLPNRCQKMAETIEANPNATCVTSGWEVIGDAGEPLETFLPDRFVAGRIDRHGDMDWCRKYRKGKSIGVHGATSMWSRRLVTEYGPIASDVPAEDAVLSFRAYILGAVVYLPDVLVRYRTHAGNIHGVLEEDLIVLEQRRTKFAERSLATFRQIEKDFVRYVDGGADVGAVSKVGLFLGLAAQNNEIVMMWWEKHCWWKMSKVVSAAIDGDWITFRWRLARLGSRSLFVRITNAKRYVLGKFFLCK